MSKELKPTIVVSRCLGFENCRWNGVTVNDPFVERLKPFVKFITVCPEMEIGLGTPRPPIRIVQVNGEERLVQPETGRDITKQMVKFSDTFLSGLENVDGFILKFRSPSCGLFGIKVFPGMEKCSPCATTRGFFGREVLERFPGIPIEDEGRLLNFRIREHFLTRAFMLARFRAVIRSRQMKELVRFHSENKLLLMAYNQRELNELGRICARGSKKTAKEVIGEYHPHLKTAMNRAPRHSTYINVIQHILGYFSRDLTTQERSYLINLLDQLRAEKIPLSVPISLVRSWVLRFQQEYLMPQTIFEPYPLELVEISDSGQGRDLKR